MKKKLAILLLFVIALGTVHSVRGIGSGGSVMQRLRLGLDMVGGVSIVLEADLDDVQQPPADIMEQVRAVIENRVDAFGLTEPIIAVEGQNRIRVELPGAQDATSAIELIGQTAQLAFKTADGNTVVTGRHVKNASAEPYSGYDAQLIGTYTVSLEFDAEGARAFEEATRAIMDGKIHSTDGRFARNQIVIFLDDRIISEPVVTSVISGTKSQITGRFDYEGAAVLAALIRGGSLPVPLTEVQSEVVGPTLGLDVARQSLIAGAIGVAMIFMLMLVYYRAMGLVADLGLLLYLWIVLWAMVAMKAVLTLPGIAGIILSVGMAVDSNVLIFSRIREELAEGKSVRAAMRSGYKRALATIFDSQITTIIAALLLYQFGTGPVRGFATTLLIGILASLFTAVFVSQLFLEQLAESRRFGVEKTFGKPKKAEKAGEPFSWVAHRKRFYAFSVALIFAGLLVGGVRGFNTGIDFTGGTILQFDLGHEVSVSDIYQTLLEQGVKAEIQHAGKQNEKIVLKTTQVLDSAERASLAEHLRKRHAPDRSEEEFFEHAGLMGPTVGAKLKSDAVKSLAFASVAMLAYIAFRFEWRFGIVAIIALLHDALMLFAFYGLFRIQINSPFIAGLLIVIGYSINDTIVIFDRIRENREYMKKSKLEHIIDTSIHQSLVRSIMTSVTTALAILPLVFLSGSAVRAFALPLLAGVAFGTMSSITVASGLYYTVTLLTNPRGYEQRVAKR